MTDKEYMDLWGYLQFYDIMALRIFNGKEMVETKSKGCILIDVGEDAIKQIENYDDVPRNKIIQKLRRIKTHYLIENNKNDS